MTYSLKDLAWLLKKLEDYGLKGVIVGSTVIGLALGLKRFEGDVDIFVIEPSPLVYEDFYREIAEKEGWELGYTGLGTPRFVAVTPSGAEVTVEFYENIFDYYVPQGIIERSSEKVLGGVTLRFIRPEDYVVLKARAAREGDVEDLRTIAGQVRAGRLRLDRRLIKEALGMMPEEEQGFIRNKLREVGIL
ncbi:MAG: nucleotidyltransferase [Hyperthermus sp.]|nr:MAG: nucleotidyltransferase [Hyperthermus sp.]